MGDRITPRHNWLGRLRRRLRSHSACDDACDLSLLEPVKGEPAVGSLLDELRDIRVRTNPREEDRPPTALVP